MCRLGWNALKGVPFIDFIYFYSFTKALGDFFHVVEQKS